MLDLLLNYQMSFVFQILEREIRYKIDILLSENPLEGLHYCIKNNDKCCKLADRNCYHKILHKFRMSSAVTVLSNIIDVQILIGRKFRFMTQLYTNQVKNIL